MGHSRFGVQGLWAQGSRVQGWGLRVQLLRDAGASGDCHWELEF